MERSVVKYNRGSHKIIEMNNNSIKCMIKILVYMNIPTLAKINSRFILINFKLKFSLIFIKMCIDLSCQSFVILTKLFEVFKPCMKG